MKRANFRFLFVLALYPGVALAEQCPGAGCRVPFPVRGEGVADARILDLQIEHERSVMSLMSKGANTASCATVRSAARSVGRLDIVQSVALTCKRQPE